MRIYICIYPDKGGFTATHAKSGSWFLLLLFLLRSVTEELAPEWSRVAEKSPALRPDSAIFRPFAEDLPLPGCSLALIDSNYIPPLLLAATPGRTV